MTDCARYGPRAVIAGGSEGVGAEFAKALAQDGFDLVLIARKPEPLAEMPGLTVHDPAEVAREGLRHIADSPVFIAGGNAEQAARNSAPDRAAVVLGAHETVKRLTSRSTMP
ncbi:hypothetical protein ACTWP6_11695 [Mycobacterium sp. 4D054]|uniref:hypothetical protein n=1 Tax=Mycobacterium sp. 4D054 TaxID=3457440 RepID=UPI003FD3A7FC